MLSKVNVSNEIDTLAEDICKMTEELGSCINEPQDSAPDKVNSEK